MFKLFALQGTSCSGKTSVLCSLIDEIKNSYKNANVQIICKRHKTLDIAVIITLPDGRKIGIETQGDPGSRLMKTLKVFQNENCEIIYCPTRTKGMTVDWVNALKPKYEIEFIKKIKHDNQNDKNVVSNLRHKAGI